MTPSALLLLLFLKLVSSGSSLLPPRTSFLLNSADRPLVVFSLPDVHNTTMLLLSDDGHTLYVGARDAVLSLDVSQSNAIHLKNKIDWRPSESEIRACEGKGKNGMVDCPNFVSVLQPMNSSHLFVCGSYAYSPRDAFIDTESFSIVQNNKVKHRCPSNPFQKNTAITFDGELFTATTTDFRGVTPQISRHFSKDGRQDVSQDSSISLLDEPTFVSSSPDPSQEKLYFFFSEVGKEFSFVDTLQTARVAQVCKDDVGGQRTLQNKWTSFAKAPLLCQFPKRLPFNILQDVFTLQTPEDGDASNMLFYAVFTSQWSSGPESAVCVFKLQDIRDVFAGSYRTFDMQTHQWSPMLGKLSYLGKCGLDSATDSELMQVKKNFLTSGSVRGIPIVVSSKQRYNNVAALRTQAANGKQYTVLFLLSESGFLHKVVLLNEVVHVIEEIQVFTQPQTIKSIVLSSSKGILYVGTSEGVTGVPVARCSIYKSCSQCVLARDPLCGWNETSGVCTRVTRSPNNMAQDLENGNVGEQCQGETRTSRVTEVNVRLNEAVRLQCVKPSTLATLTWSSAYFKTLPETLFIQSADGGLNFLASPNTFGTYTCVAEEGGYKEVIASYNVQQVFSPRSISPRYHGDKKEVEDVEDIATEDPITPMIRPTDVTQDDPVNEQGVEFTTGLQDESFDINDSGLGYDYVVTSPLTPGNDKDFQKEPLDGPVESKEKSYFSELVVVSLLLAICICLLIVGGLNVWRQREADLKTSPLVSPDHISKTNQSLESVPSLNCPEDADAELKVVV